jgi:hypothetical protein
MMRYSPTIIVQRVTVLRNDQAAYDEKFHEGVNVIRGDNSSGKSTVLNFIFYGLGGDFKEWSAIARLCTRVVVEVRINGSVLTLSREISLTNGQQPMEIFSGNYEASTKAPLSEWAKFPYKTTSNRESFSQALFRIMEIPEVSSDLSGHITLHQILRLLYADQLSPVENIFRAEPFDRADLRDTVGRLLCGAYDSSIYDNEQRARELVKQFDTINGQLRSLFSVLSSVDDGFTQAWIDAQGASLDKERADLQASIEELEHVAFAGAKDDRLTLGAQEEAYTEVQSLQQEIGKAKTERDALALTMADSRAFISGLAQKIHALQDSSRIAEHIGVVHFESCPACYAPIDRERQGHLCQLCQTPFDSDGTRSRIAALILDTGLQIKQSEQLQARRTERASTLDKLISAVSSRWAEASRRLAGLQRLPSSALRQDLRNLHQKAGYLERQREDLEQKARLAATVRELSAKKDELSNEIAKLRSSNEALRAQQEVRLSTAYSHIADEVLDLLRRDLRRQDIFEDPQQVTFTFGDNSIFVDEESYFSASSRAILKSCFYLGFLAAATKHNFFRHPRFCMIDTHENMGVEAIRSQNFQLQALRISKESKVEHQIIYATAMIEPELEDEAYTIGAFSTNDERTIAIKM